MNNSDGYRYLLNDRAFRNLNIQRALQLQKSDTSFPAKYAITHIVDNEGAVGFSEARLTESGSLRLPGTFEVSGGATFGGAVSINGETTIDGSLIANANIDILGNVIVASDLTVNGNIIVDKDITIDGNIIVDNDITSDGNITTTGDITLGGLIKSTRAKYPYSQYESVFNANGVLTLNCVNTPISTSKINILWKKIAGYDGTLGSFIGIPAGPNITDAGGSGYSPTGIGITWKSLVPDPGLYTITVTLIGRIEIPAPSSVPLGTQGAVNLYLERTVPTTKLNPPFIFNDSLQFQTITIPITCELKENDGITLTTSQIGSTSSILLLREGSSITFLRHC